jgi:hypothetical protein
LAAFKAQNGERHRQHESLIGRAADPKEAAALSFVQTVVRERGEVAARDIAAVRAAGWDDADIVELVGHAVASTLTNYLHQMSDVPVDFPAVDFASSPRAEEAA